MQSLAHVERETARRLTREVKQPRVRRDMAPYEAAGLTVSQVRQLSLVAVASFAEGKLARARAQFELLARLAPDLYLPHHYLAMICWDAAQFDQAAVHAENARIRLERLDRGAEQEEVYHDVLFLLAESLVQSGQSEKARIHLQELERCGDRVAVQLRQHLKDRLTRASK